MTIGMAFESLIFDFYKNMKEIDCFISGNGQGSCGAIRAGTIAPPSDRIVLYSYSVYDPDSFLE
jgi:hypothetical protein